MTDKTARIAAEIDAEIEGTTVLDLFHRNATTYADKPALRWKVGSEWRTATWADFAARSSEIAAGLIALGVQPKDHVAIMARNVPEHLIADAGALHAGAIPVSIYNTLAPDQIAYIANDLKAKVAVLENREFAKRWEEIRAQLPALEHIILINDADDFRYLGGQMGSVLSWDELVERGREHLAKEPNVVRARTDAVKPEDPLTVVYTSGTTGPPKGTIITHRNTRWTMESVFRHFDAPMHLSAVSYLPLAHVAERAVTYAASVRQASVAYFCPEITDAIEVVKEAHPYIFLGVPRVWEKVKAGVEKGLNEEGGVKGTIARTAIDVGIRAVRAQQSGSPLATPLGIARQVFEPIVYKKIREKIGLEKTRIALTGAAPLAPDVMEFFHAIGVQILDTWGMTELTVVASINPQKNPRIGTVGVPLPGVEIKIADDGEILARGGLVTAGYLNRPTETAETYKDGWVHSGDLGAFDPDGHLRIVGRKKELIITAGGKNIAPNNIEALIKEHPLVGQACVVGDARPYLTALITLEPEAAAEFATSKGIDPAALATDAGVQAEIQGAIDNANRRLAKVESVKRFVLLPTEWTPESGELTPTMKLKRNVIKDRYATEIDSLYAS